MSPSFRPDPTHEADDRVLSASVAMQPVVDMNAGIPATSTEVAYRLPTPAAVERIQTAFREIGFEVGAEYAGTFSITGARSLFERVFSSWPTDRFSEAALAEASETELELPTSDVADALGDDAEEVQAVFFTAVPEFGPFDP